VGEVGRATRRHVRRRRRRRRRRRNRVTLLLALKAALRKLGILRALPKDDLHYAAQRQKELVKEIRRTHGFQTANQAMDEIDAMMARSVPSEHYPAAELVDDMTDYLRAKYLPYSLLDPES
jgi:hypothetical protein